MAAPTQEYPPWLTPIPTVVPDANGAPTTSTTVLFLPLTYFGPSIPLGPDWTYGGLTPPPSTSTTLTTSTSAIPSETSSITTAIPPTSISSSLPLSSSTTSSSIFTSSVTSPSISSSTVVNPTQTSGPTGASRLTRGQLVGVIVASILGFIFLLVLILAAYLFCKGKHRRRSRANGGPIDDDYFIVPPGGRVPGEGSPRHSGEEGDPFLRPSGGGGGTHGEMTEKAIGSGTAYTEMGTRPPVPPKVPRVPPPPTTSLSSSNSSSTNSGYGEPLAQPTLGIRPIREEHEQEMSGGRILTPEELQRIDQETVLPPEAQQSQGDNGEQYSGAYAYADTPLLPPPKLVDPASRSSAEFTLPRPPFGKQPSRTSQRSSGLPPDVDEHATLLTARKVRVEDLAPRSSPGSSPVTEEADTSKPSTSSFLGAIASRLSWRRSQSPRTSQHQPLLRSSPLSDRDLEQGRALPPLPPAPQMSETVSSRGGASIGLGPDGTRPISSVSGKSQNSGGTIYHDAYSSLPATPTLTPLPRAATPSDTGAIHVPPVPAADIQHRPSVPSQLGQTQTLAPAAREEEQKPSQVDSPTVTSLVQNLTPGFDILDMPAPSAISSFGSNSTFSLKASTTSDTTIVNPNNATNTSIRTYPFPPGLQLIPTPKAWADLNGTTPSPGSYAGDQDGVGVGITIDVLEEEPPSAGEGWRSIAAATTGGGAGDERLGRRTTFGIPQYVHQPDFTSEQASLHSMRSHLSPSSPPRSTGSAAASRRDLSYGSNSSRPSAHSAGDGSSGALSFAQSLARSGSITSDGRKRTFGPISPALSAFGNPIRSGNGSGSGSGSDFALSREGSGNASASASGSGHEHPSASEGVTLQSPSTAYLAPARVVNTSASAMSSPPTSPLSMPWAGGLDDSWSASS